MIKRAISGFDRLDITHLSENFTQEGVLKKAFIEECATFMIVPDESGLLPNEKPDEDKTVLTALTAKSISESIQVVAYILDAFAHSAETLLGQSIGNKDKSTSLVVIFKTFIFSLLLAIVLSILIFLIGFNIFEIFTSIDVILNECKKLFPYLLLLPIISVWAFMLDGFFVGAAKSKPMRNSTLLAFCVFIILNYFIMLINPNIQYLWLSYLIFLLLRGVFLSFYFNSLFV